MERDELTLLGTKYNDWERERQWKLWDWEGDACRCQTQVFPPFPPLDHISKNNTSSSATSTDLPYIRPTLPLSTFISSFCHTSFNSISYFQYSYSITSKCPTVQQELHSTIFHNTFITYLTSINLTHTTSLFVLQESC